MFYRILDIFFVVFHTSVILFNLFGWIWRKTRKYNLILLVITGASWLILGLIVGTLGYCPLTDWHFDVLEKLGEKVEGPQIGAFEVLTTAENLADAIKGETYEIETMYPGFITTAEEQNYSDAVESFTWAIETEKKHQVIYKTALEVVNTGSEKSLPSQWLVCLVCGNTYIDKDVPNECEFCMTSKEEFMVFK